MKYIHYDREWITTDTKAKHSDLCGKGFKGFCTAIRVWLWYLGLPARIAFYKTHGPK